MSFAYTNDDEDRLRTLFQDSKIAEKYSQNETKVKYMIQYGLIPHFQDLLKSDLKGKPFSFTFDETTASQTIKQYDHGLLNFYDRIYCLFKGTLMSPYMF